MIKLIASDLDGTLLRGGAQQLNPRVFDLILQLKEKGILFVAASGRQYTNLRRLFEPVKDEIAYIAENGSLCVYQGKILSRGLIERDLGLRILKAIQNYGQCECILSCEDACYTDSKNPDFIRHMSDVVKNDMAFVDDLTTVNHPFLKIAICDYRGTQESDVYFKKLFSSEIKVVTSGNIWVDFIAPNANKGSALQGLLDHLQYKSEDCIAFGDQYNDVEMLQLAGTSYAMANAAPGISYFSTYVTDSVEEVLEDIVRGVPDVTE